MQNFSNYTIVYTHCNVWATRNKENRYHADRCLRSTLLKYAYSTCMVAFYDILNA